MKDEGNFTEIDSVSAKPMRHSGVSLTALAAMIVMMMMAAVAFSLTKPAPADMNQSTDAKDGVTMSNDELPETKACATSCGLPQDDAELRKLLTPEQYKIMKQDGTELPFSNDYWDNHEEGIYVDRISGRALFSSKDKFDSGTGWPSFTRPIQKTELNEITDSTLGMRRVEVRSKSSDSHLGHVFDDGPAPTGLRYCMNSASLKFIPTGKLQTEGLADYLPLFGKGEKKDVPTGSSADAATTGTATAMFGAGCFWGVEETFRSTPGVLATAVGYAGGKTENPTYKEVCTDKSGHAEVVHVTYDPAKVSYDQLLDVFWKNHNPTTLNRQGPDSGTQYRSAIFFYSPEQEKAARASMEKLSKSGKWRDPIVTQIEAAPKFNRAEEYHQQYLAKRGLSACHT
ncbi:bifunctional methionine sulfoxide reductase B/A protein [soil metagenome]